MTNGDKIYEIAKNCLGKNFATNDQLGCAETVNAVVKLALGFEVGGGPSTQAMFEALKYSNTFKQVIDPICGDIILSPTGQGNYPHGHVGIVAKYGVLSNDSNSGKLAEKFTLDSWKNYFQAKGGFPVLFYRAVDSVSQTPVVEKVIPVETKIDTPVSQPVSKLTSLVLSSDGSGNVGVTAKGLIIGAIPTIIDTISKYGFTITNTDALTIVNNAFSIGSVAVITFGLLRKVYYSKKTV